MNKKIKAARAVLEAAGWYPGRSLRGFNLPTRKAVRAALNCLSTLTDKGDPSPPVEPITREAEDDLSGERTLDSKE